MQDRAKEEEEIDELRSLSYAEEKVEYLEAHASFARQQWLDAARRLHSVGPLVVKLPGLARRVDLMLAQAAALLGDPDRLDEACRRLDPADPASAVERLVEASVAILARAAPIYEVIRQAAADPDVGVLLQENRHRRRDDQRRLIEVLGRSGHLRPGLDVDTAADVFYGLLNEEVFLLLTGDCGWEVDRFRGWATSLMRHQLVAPDGSVT